jgi:hypothetical protein
MRRGFRASRLPRQPLQQPRDLHRAPRPWPDGGGTPRSLSAAAILADQFRAVRFGAPRTFVRGQQKSGADAVAAIVLRFVEGAVRRQQ